MQAEQERDRLLRAMAELYAELGYEETRGDLEAVQAVAESISGRAFDGMLSEEEESLVAAVNEALARIVSAVSGAHSGSVAPPPTAIVGALGGAEMVMRGEIMAGRVDRLPRLLPSFVYLATLPSLGQEEALGLSRQTHELLLGVGQE